MNEKQPRVRIGLFNGSVKPECIECGCKNTDEIETNHINGQSICELARLEFRLEKIPTIKETIKAGLNVSNIPEGCPNEYLPPYSQFMRAPYNK